MSFSREDVVIVIPAYNEEKTVYEVVQRARPYGRVIVVDDGSRDQTFREAVKAGAVCLKQPLNLGKGAALKTGVEFALKTYTPRAIVFLDADLQHPPEEIPALLEKLGQTDVMLVHAYRQFDKNMPLVFRIGNIFFTLTSRLLFGRYLPDVLSGFKAIRAEAWPLIEWQSQGYSIEVEVFANIAKHKLRVATHPIPTIYLDPRKGTTVLHGFGVLRDLIYFRLTK